MEYVVLSALFLTPILITVVFKCNAALAFLAICTSIALLQYSIPVFTDDIRLDSNSLAFIHALEILIIVIPWFLISILTARSVRKIKLFLNIIPAICSGVAFTYLLTPYLPGEGTFAVDANSVFLDKIQTVWPYVLATGAGVSLIIVRPSKSKDKSHKKH